MSKPAFILLLTEDRAAGDRLRDALRERGGHSCHVVESLAEATASIERKAPDVVVTTGVVHGKPAGAVLAKLLDRTARDAALLILGDNPEAVSTRYIDFLLLPEKDEIADYVAAIDRAANSAAGRRDDRLLSETFQSYEVQSFEGIVGETPRDQDDHRADQEGGPQ
jgi:DNA-binding NtrC family response regulator